MIVLDTEVLAELLKSDPDASLMGWLATQCVFRSIVIMDSVRT